MFCVHLFASPFLLLISLFFSSLLFLSVFSSSSSSLPHCSSSSFFFFSNPKRFRSWLSDAILHPLGKVLSCDRQRVLLSLIAEHGGFADEYSVIKSKESRRSKLKNRAGQNETSVTVKGNSTTMPFKFITANVRNIIASDELWHLVLLIGSEEMGPGGSLTRYFSRVSCDFQATYFPPLQKRCDISSSGEDIKPLLSPMVNAKEEEEEEEEERGRRKRRKGMSRVSKNREDEGDLAVKKVKVEDVSDSSAKEVDTASSTKAELLASGMSQTSMKYTTRHKKNVSEAEQCQSHTIDNDEVDGGEGVRVPSSEADSISGTQLLVFSFQAYSQYVRDNVNESTACLGGRMSADVDATINECCAADRVDAAGGVKMSESESIENGRKNTSKDVNSETASPDASLSLQQYLDAAFMLGREYVRGGSMVLAVIDSGNTALSTSSTALPSSNTLGPSLCPSAPSSSSSLSLSPNRSHGTIVPLALCTVLKVLSLSATESRAQMLKCQSPPLESASLSSKVAPTIGPTDETAALSSKAHSEASDIAGLGRTIIDPLSPPEITNVGHDTITIHNCSDDAAAAPENERDREADDSKRADIEWVTVFDGKVRKTIPLSSCRQLDITEEKALYALQTNSYNAQKALSSLRGELDRSRRQHLAALTEGGGKCMDTGVIGGDLGTWTKRELEIFVAAKRKYVSYCCIHIAHWILS